jgi:hypothetical protein
VRNAAEGDPYRKLRGFEFPEILVYFGNAPLAVGKGVWETDN